MWASGFGGGQTTDGNAVTGSSTATSRIYGVAAGADYRLSQATVAGFALAGGGTNFSVASGGSGRTDLFQAGAFIKHTVGSAYVSAAAAYGWHDVTTDRTVTIAGIDQLRARFAANTFAGRRRRRQSLRHTMVRRPRCDALRRCASDRHPPSRLCRDRRLRHQCLCVVLSGEERDRAADRTRIAQRQILCRERCAADIARPRRLGA